MKLKMGSGKGIFTAMCKQTNTKVTQHTT